MVKSATYNNANWFADDLGCLRIHFLRRGARTGRPIPKPNGRLARKRRPNALCDSDPAFCCLKSFTGRSQKQQLVIMPGLVSGFVASLEHQHGSLSEELFGSLNIDRQLFELGTVDFEQVCRLKTYRGDIQGDCCVIVRGIGLIKRRERVQGAPRR